MKKTILLFFLLAMLTGNLFSQDGEYIPMLIKGNQWNEHATRARKDKDYKIIDDSNSWNVLKFPSGGGDYYKTTEHIYFDGDSIIGDYSYKKTFSDHDPRNEIKVYRGLIREEGQKVYIIHSDSEEERLSYDFSLEEGMMLESAYYPDNFPEYSLYVGTVDSIEINGSMRKRIKIVEAAYQWEADTWIEGIGSIYGPLYSCHFLFLEGETSTLLCHYQDEELIYKNPTYSECYYDYRVSTETIIDDVYSIFPNPVEDILTISSSGDTISRIEIFDTTGKKVHYQLHDEAIGMASFQKGVYFIKVYDKKEAARIFKIIKK